jgi:hypothetical protein
MRPAYLNRHIALLQQRKEKFEIVNDSIYKLYNNMIVPFGPANRNFLIDKEEAEVLLKKLGGLLVRCTDGFQQKELPWYAIICDEFMSVDEMKSKHRSEINRGLKKCEVKRVDAVYFANHFYEVFDKAMRGYQKAMSAPFTESEFRLFFNAASSFDDIVHFWGVFIDNKPVAFSVNYIYDKIESSISLVKSDPQYNADYPSYALFYKINEYYLEEQKFGFVNDGFRSVLHNTNVQGFLEKKFNFRKAHTHLSLFYRPALGAAVKITYPFRTLIRKFDNRFSALYALEEYSRYK